MRKIIKFIVRNIPRPLMIKLSKLVFFIKPFYLGNKVECPICKKHYRKFLPYGNNAGVNRLCPNCLSLERHRLIWIYLNKKTDFFQANHKFLHFAPEQPFIKRFKKLKNLNYTTADIVSPIADLHIDILKTGLESNNYDIIFANHVLEHVENDIFAMKEIFRLLKSGGWAIMQVPINFKSQITDEDPNITDPKEREKRFGQYDHVRYHGLDYPNRLESVGFIVEKFEVEKIFSQNQIERIRLDKNEILYIAKKQ
ncbi:MAG: class I SAM-dependent methyltransferase [Bacteroidales bacterium]|jgi:SAM-dependent methyltransferase|nr:class I SAM-dependent methyltransferase [Bacteroidales bacterium]